MIIHEPEIVSKNGEVFLQAHIETSNPNAGLPEKLWFSFPESWSGKISTRTDSILASLILVAMTTGKDIECRGELSPRLYYNLDEYQNIFNHWQPEFFHRIEIKPEILTPAPGSQNEPAYATSFSGGVDSFFTIHELLNPTPDRPNWPLKYTFFMHGSPDIPLSFSQKYQSLEKQYTKVARQLGLELIPVRTNLMHFCVNRIDIKLFLESPLSGVALGLSPHISGIFIPSGRFYQCYTDSTTGPLTTHLLSTESFETFSHGSTTTRFQKTLTISGWAPAQENLRVCLGWTDSEVKNCSQCSKCLRTRADLNTIGKLEKFSTLKSPFSWRDTLRWGRWMETGYGFEREILNYALKHRKDLVPGIVLSILIGTIRHWLRKYLPLWLKQQIFKFTAEKNPHQIFASDTESQESVPHDHLNS